MAAASASSGVVEEEGSTVVAATVPSVTASVVGMGSVVAVAVAGHAPSPGWQWVAPMHALPLLTAGTAAK